MFSYIARKLFGTRNDRYIKSLKPIIQKCNSLEEQMQALSDEEFKIRINEYKNSIQSGEKTLDEMLPEVFALVREASLRSLAMRHYDVQLIGGIALHQGKISEMKTGEGKTLVATLPVVLNALSGKGVHVVTVNDYLAQRDAEWMGQLYNFLGLSVGVIIHGLKDEQRREAYHCDITYGTNNEFGFDFLRDNMKFHAQQLVQREHSFAIVDEVDSILIDEARTPLVISGAVDQTTGMYIQANTLIKQLVLDEDFTIDEKARTALLTDQGVAKCEKLLNIDNLFDPNAITIQHHILQALRANNCYKNEIDYLVTEEKKIVIVDEFTGRPMPGRRFGDGLHQALEAKENVAIQSENQTLASITYQNYFRMYDKLAGMTGTAETEAVEFAQIYSLEVISIPPNKIVVRKDFPDVIYRTQKEKYDAIINAIVELHQKGQPVLVGTISIESSELLSKILTKAKIPHNVLNAKYQAQEAQIIAQAGQKGKVTIATNMAGRGTDIVLGENVIELGGLHILGTERHESRRIDNQLRGRSGRQGDPGSSRFYLSLEDNLMRIFGSDRLSSIMQKLGMEEGEPIENNMVTRAIENAQKRVEGHFFEVRKTLLEYDNVMNQQREVIYDLRHEFMQNSDLQPMLEEYIDDFLEAAYEEEDDVILTRLKDVGNMTKVSDSEEIPSLEEAKERIYQVLDMLKEEAGQIYKDIVRYFLLEELDRAWKEHLRNMDQLREGIGLRGYGQRDPKLEYKKEGFALFQEMLLTVRENSIRALTHVKVKKPENSETPPPITAPQADEQLQAQAAPQQQLSAVPEHKEQKMEIQQPNQPSTKKQATKTHTAGRNDPCPCGSGLKYKKCCGNNNA